MHFNVVAVPLAHCVVFCWALCVFVCEVALSLPFSVDTLFIVRGT